MPRLNRRQFLAASLASGIWAAGAHAGEPVVPPVCVFSKHLQFLDYKALATTCRAIGVDGIDLTVREKGHVSPENVGRDLPAAVEAIRAEGLAVPMITTGLNDGADPTARPILETAAKLGIRYFRIGGLLYDNRGDILAQIAAFTGKIRGLATLAQELGMTAGYHNHSGRANFGAPVWDLLRMFEAVDSPHLGANFDCGHATVEGGFGDWQITARALAARVKMMAVKDFVWDGAKPQWVPLGKGVVQTAAILEIMRNAGFHGPVSMHFEYKVSSDDAMIEEVRAAASTLRTCLKQAGYA